MVAVKIVFTILGIWVVCSKTAPSNPALTRKLLAQPDDKDIEVPVQRRSEGKRSTENRYDATSTSRQHRVNISRILNRVLLRNPLLRNPLKIKNINDKRPSQVSLEEDSENASASQVSPNVHSDYLHIENYVPTFITIPCNPGSCDPSSYGNANCQILSDIVQSDVSSTNTILCAQQASSNDLPTHDVIEDQSLIIPEAPALMPLSPPSTGFVLSNTNEKISESASSLSSNDNLSDTEFSKELQSEISNLSLLQSEHLDTPELSSLPISYLHPEIHASYYDIVNDAINEDLHVSDYHRFAEFTSYPQLSLTANDEIITPGIQTNLPLNSPSPFESTGLIPEPPTYVPLKPAHIEPEEQKKGEEIVSLLDPYEPSHIVTIPEDTPSTFENQPIVVIPEAPALMPLNPPNISYDYIPENTATFDHKLETTYSDYSEIAQTTPQRGDIIDSTDNTNIETNLAENPAGPIESDILIPEPPIYFPLNPPKNNLGGQRPGEIVSLLDNYESSYTITIPENTLSSVDSLPIKIPEAPELIPLNPPNITFGSYLENKTYENKQTIHSDYLDPSPEIVTEFEKITGNNYLLIPPAPGLLPLNLPNTFHSYENKNSVSVGTELTSSTVQTYGASTKHTIDHAHSPTLDDSPNLLISHYFNTQNKVTSENFEPVTSPSNYETTSLYETIEISKASELTPSNLSHSYLISSESSSLYDKNNNDDITFYDQEKASLSAASIKIPEAPVLPPLSPPFTSPPYNSVVPSNLSIDSQVIKDENNIKEVAYFPSQSSTSESETYNGDIFVNSKVFATKQPNSTDVESEESELKSENTPLHIMLSMNQQIIVPHNILHNANDLESNNHYEIQGQRGNSVASSSECSSSVQEHSEPLSISQNSNIVVSVSPIAVEKTNAEVSQLDSTIQQLTTQDTEKKVQLNFRDLPPCKSEKPVDGIVINNFESQKCKQEVQELKTTSSSKHSTSNRSRRRKVVVRNRKGKRTNVTKNDS